MRKEELIIVIPAYEPDELLIGLIDRLNGFFENVPIVIVNDGSVGSKEIFDTAVKKDNVTLLAHDVNKGKGRALKTAFEYIKKLDENHHVIVTADSDGQHRPEDILRVCEYYYNFNNGLILGSRLFEGDVPFRSRFGNDATRVLFKLVNNKHIYDTQTGLRAFGSELLDLMINVPGERYEYEMNMLSEVSRNNYNIEEIKIETVYIENNRASHFRPVRDFLRICRVIMKYSINYLLTLICYGVAFAFLLYGFRNTLYGEHLALSTALSAAVFTLIFNVLVHLVEICYGNRKMFVNSKKLTRYLITAVVMILIASLGCYGLAFVLPIWASALISGLLAVVVTILVNYFTSPKTKIKKD